MKLAIQYLLATSAPPKGLELAMSFMLVLATRVETPMLDSFVHEDDEYQWLQSFMTSAKVKELIGYATLQTKMLTRSDDWRKEFFLERCEMPNLKAVHFVIYGLLGRGVSSVPYWIRSVKALRIIFVIVSKTSQRSF